MESQKGWRRCNVCQAVFQEDSPGQSCIGGAMHSWPTSFEYKAPWGEVLPGCQAGWGRCTKCGGLAYRGNVGVCFDGGPHGFDDFDASYNVPFQDVAGVDLQAGWRWCNRCQRLWHADHPPGSCFAGGSHDGTGSLGYLLPFADLGLQHDWAWCSTCQGLVRFGADGCADGGQHTTTSGTEYRVAYGGQRDSDQTGWCSCSRCHRLVFGAAGGVCALGGAHEFADSLPYTVPLEVEPPDAQPGWRWCQKCQALGYTGFSIGPCPAGGTHDVGASGSYSVWPSSLHHGQPGWRRCARCLSLVLSSVTGGPCRDGNPHDTTSSPAYEAFEGGVDFGEEGSFAWCHRCQALVHGGVGSTGFCFDGFPHDTSESQVYGIPRDNPPDGAQPGWRLCSRCAQLFLPDEGGGAGACVDGVGGAGHDATGSPELLVAMMPAPPPAVAVATIALIESDTTVAVDGTGFPPATSVTVSFIASGVTMPATITSDASGSFHLERSPVVAAPPEGGLVLAKAGADAVATGRLTRVVPAPPDP